MAAVEKVRVSFYLTHTWDADLEFVLEAPDGTSRMLTEAVGSGNDNFGTSAADADRTTFDDDSPTAIDAAVAPFVGSFQPTHLLSIFIGLEATGTWQLKVIDTQSGDVGTVRAASLFITTGGVEHRYDATGLPAAIPDDTPVGRVVSFVVSDGGTGDGETSDPDTDDTATGIGLLPRPAEPGYFRIKITSLHYGAPDRPAKTLKRLENFTEASVTIPINDAREATVKISSHAPAAGVLDPYKTMLHVVYATPTRSYLVFWGIITQPVWDPEEGTVTIPAVDLALRLQNRQVRWGRRILNSADDSVAPNPFNDTKPRRSTGFVPLDYVGLGWLRDGARLNQPQSDAGWPPLGITDGINTADGLPLDTDYKIEARRGDIIWDVIQEMASYQITPDFELEPVDDIFGVYARLNTHPRQGSADHSRLIFEDGFGKDNCRVTYQPGGKLINFAHVLSTGDEKRVTVSDQDSGAIYGPYTGWDSTDYPAKALAALGDTAAQTINAYGVPPDYFSLAPNLDSGMYYLDHFKVGDALTARVRNAELKRVFLGDITQVKLTQDDDAGNVKPELEVAVNVSRTITDETEG